MPRIVRVLQRFGKSECPSQRDLLIPKAEASVFSLFTFKPEHAPEFFSATNKSSL